ncbi:MAG: hypothetical protein OXI93_11600, partial [Bryobacterales bacterium]|nr:hypothetical protein [Bryobacterales bacterium]
IVAYDPLRLHFAGEILNVRIRKVTREVLRFTADTSEEASGTVCWGFEFLDPGDGGVLEVLHSGPVEAPKCTGTIMGLPKGLQYRPREGTSRWYRRLLLVKWLPLGVVMLIVGLSATLHGILGVFGASDQFDHPLLSSVIFGFLTLYPIMILLLLRQVWLSLSSPSSLDL